MHVIHAERPERWVHSDTVEFVVLFSDGIPYAKGAKKPTSVATMKEATTAGFPQDASGRICRSCLQHPANDGAKCQPIPPDSPSRPECRS